TLPLWDVPLEGIMEVRMKKGDNEYALKRDGIAWKITGPFEAPAVGKEVLVMTMELSDPKREKYVVHETDDAKKYGLDAPALLVTLSAKANEKDKSYKLEIGKPVDKEKSRYARLEGDKAVFTVSEKFVQSIDHSAFDLLDHTLARVDPKAIQQVRVNGGQPFTLKQQKDEWQIVDSPAKPFAPDSEAVQETLRPWSNLRAERFVAYGPKINWAEYGLDKPATSVTVSAAGKEHTLALGKDVPDHPGERYARFDKHEGVAVLAAPTVRDLNRTHLDFVDRGVLKFDLDAVNAIERHVGKVDLEILKKDDTWHLVKPAAHAADTPVIDSILERTFRLRAKRIAAYPAKDLALFGLDQPEAVVTLKLGGDTPLQHVIKIGKPAIEPGKKESDERYAVVGDSTTVFVLDQDLSKQLLASALAFRDRNLASFSAADKVVLERGDRKATF